MVHIRLSRLAQRIGHTSALFHRHLAAKMTRASMGHPSIAMVVCLSMVLPAGASAYATIGPSTKFSGISGLPDGRAYEHVSPFNKYGNAAGGSTSVGLAGGMVAPDGDLVSYLSTGPISENSTGSFAGKPPVISQRSANGWSTRSFIPRSVRTAETDPERIPPSVEWFLPSEDFSHIAFYYSDTEVGQPDENGLGENLYLIGQDPLVEPDWIGRPQVEVPDYKKNQEIYGAAVPIGGTPDLSTVYFTWGGELLPQDTQRGAQSASDKAWSLYEYTNGVLREAGVLPDGSTPLFGAVPAGFALSHGSDNFNSPDQLGNEVSADGRRVFFVSPEPRYSKYSAQCSECSTEATELYVRETSPDGSQRTVLVSQSQLPGSLGDPAPHGPLAVKNTSTDESDYPIRVSERASVEGGGPSYVYASREGSHAFFQSIDRLTSSAPNDISPKVYDFDLKTGLLRYLPGVDGAVVGGSDDGSELLFENTTTSPFELELWVDDPTGGTVRPIAELPESSVTCKMSMASVTSGYMAEATPSVEPVCVGPVRMSSDGNVIVFQAGSPIPGFNDGKYSQQIFRYDVSSDELSCVSCPPIGISPNGDAILSNVDAQRDVQGETGGTDWVGSNRAISRDASRVFFETPSSLVPQDINGKRDIYEWEDGAVFLLSAGTSAEGSLLIDDSESGNDVFFSTTSDLVLADNDGTYDVYDARVPRPGDVSPPSALPCEGDVCRGPPSVPELLTAPASSTFSGAGNVVPSVAKSSPPSKSAVKHKQLHRKKKRVHRQRHVTKAKKRNSRGKR